MPELIAGMHAVDLVLKNAGEASDDAKLRTAFEQRTLA
jgi:hypothetical protein